MTGIKITAERILADWEFEKKNRIRLLLTVIGIVCLILGAICLRGFGSLAFCVLFIVLLFTWVVGISPLIKLCKRKKHICTGKIKVYRDVVTEKKKVGQRYLLMFQEYTARTEKGIRQTEVVCNTTKIGDEFLLVYVNEDVTPVAIYRASEYWYSNDLSKQGNNDRQEITKELILKDAKVKREYLAYGFSVLLGIMITIFPVIQIGEINQNVIISMVFLFLTFGLLFGVLFGLKPLIRTIKTTICIKTGKMKIVKDRLIDKQYRDRNDYRSCLLMFEDYTAKTGMGIFRSGKTYEQLKRGEEFYLVYVEKVSEPILVYSANQYYC